MISCGLHFRFLIPGQIHIQITLAITHFVFERTLPNEVQL